jgi:SagB-type dehydrogenase family enzyme
METCLGTRRSVRDYDVAPVSLKELGQLLWAIQGVSGLGGLRTCPSAGAVYPLRTYVMAGRVEGAPAGLYEYDADQHAVAAVGGGDKQR